MSAARDRPLRIAFPPIGGPQWIGGQNYLANLVLALRTYVPCDVQPVLFVDDRYAPAMIATLAAAGAEIVYGDCFAAGRHSRRSAFAVVTGADRRALAHYRQHGIDIVFESATYHGWRFALPTIAWFPDFQHRHLPHMFGRAAWWRRDIGFRLSLARGETVMLSSEDAARDLAQFYPGHRATAHVVRFAVPAPPRIDAAEIRSVCNALEVPARYFYLPNHFWAHKNHVLVIEALALAHQRAPDIIVVCTGNPHDPRQPGAAAALVARVTALGLQSSFRSLGVVPYAQVLALMQGAAALINPSLFEGWSTVVEEAKSIGLPMILSDLPVHREQAEGQAEFFDRTQPRALANAMIAMWDRETPSAPLPHQANAIREFAERFAATARASVHHRCERK